MFYFLKLITPYTTPLPFDSYFIPVSTSQDRIFPGSSLEYRNEAHKVGYVANNYSNMDGLICAPSSSSHLTYGKITMPEVMKERGKVLRRSPLCC